MSVRQNEKGGGGGEETHMKERKAEGEEREIILYYTWIKI